MYFIYLYIYIYIYIVCVCEKVPPGNLVGIEGLAEDVFKSATLSSTKACPSFGKIHGAVRLVVWYKDYRLQLCQSWKDQSYKSDKFIKMQRSKSKQILNNKQKNEKLEGAKKKNQLTKKMNYKDYIYGNFYNKGNLNEPKNDKHDKFKQQR